MPADRSETVIDWFERFGDGHQDPNHRIMILLAGRIETFTLKGVRSKHLILGRAQYQLFSLTKEQGRKVLRDTLRLPISINVVHRDFET